MINPLRLKTFLSPDILSASVQGVGWTDCMKLREYRRCVLMAYSNIASCDEAGLEVVCVVKVGYSIVAGLSLVHK